MNRLIQSKNKIILPVLIALTLACFALSPQARAVCQQGCDLANGNTFLGDDALINNTTGENNTATGSAALRSNTTGSQNTATGHGTLNANTSGFDNTATGRNALLSNTEGAANTAPGVDALTDNTTGFENTATGDGALEVNTIGDSNTATGVQALFHTNGRGNIALGFQAGVNLTTGSNNIDIGNAGVAGESNKIRVGTEGTQTNAYIAGIYSTPVAKGFVVKVDFTGHLGTVGSSGRFKDDIKPMDKTSEAILALKPATFRYKKELDPEGTPQFGLVAEDVEKIDPDLVVRDPDEKLYSVRYDAVNVMLLNEFLKEHKTVQEQGATITALRANDSKQEVTIARREQTVAALNAALQKVSAQLELSKSARHVAEKNQ